MFIIYSKTPCPYCLQAKNLLASKGLQYQELQLDNGAPKNPLFKYYTLAELQEKLPGARTVPQIWYYDETKEGPSFPTHYIGGFHQLEEYLKNV